MPIFEFRCMKCGASFERLVPNAESQVTCEHCGSKQVEKQLSTFSTSVANKTTVPCAGGACPTSGMGGTGCSGGGCPFS